MAKTLSLAQRAKKDPKLKARALANPGLRSKLPASMLPAEMRNRRALNQRLKQPITQGSSITEGDLARESKAAMQVKYGDVEQGQRQRVQEEQQRQRDFTGPGGFYDQYLRADGGELQAGPEHRRGDGRRRASPLSVASAGSRARTSRSFRGRRTPPPRSRASRPPVT
jgi:hypothetical protein